MVYCRDQWHATSASFNLFNNFSSSSSFWRSIEFKMGLGGDSVVVHEMLCSIPNSKRIINQQRTHLSHTLSSIPSSLVIDIAGTTLL